LNRFESGFGVRYPPRQYRAAVRKQATTEVPAVVLDKVEANSTAAPAARFASSAHSVAD
jgi:hypothetical protein